MNGSLICNIKPAKNEPALLDRPFANRTVFITQQLICKREDRTILAIPYPTSVHLPSREVEPEMPWNKFEYRSKLAVFVGSSFVNKNRDKIKEISSNDTRCEYVKTRRDKRFNASSSIHHYSNSVFCPRVAGNGRARKGFDDAITSGCIPVLFWGKSSHEMGNDGTRAFWPFADQIDYFNLTVSFNLKEALYEGKLIQVLDEIPEQRVKELQANIAKVARSLQYSVFDDEMDVFHTIMRMLFKLKQSSICPKYSIDASMTHCFSPLIGVPMNSSAFPSRTQIPWLDRWLDTSRNRKLL